MIFSAFFGVIFSALFWIDISNGLRAVPARANITYYNIKYIEDSTFTITRFGRKSPYFFNIYANILSQWNNNVTIHLEFKEYLHNEYRPSFIEFKQKFCDFLSSNEYIGNAINRAGMSCPLKPKFYRLENITFPTENFPNVFPFKKGRIDVTITKTEDKTVMETGYVEVNFDLDKKKSSMIKTAVV